MIRFYPRDIGRWRKTFSFDPESITLEIKDGLPRWKDFHSRAELIEFLKDHGVVLTNTDYPLEFNSCEGKHHAFGYGVSTVHQWTVQGWIKDVY